MPSPVSPIHFADRMERHWTDTLGNASSDNLKTIWRQMGQAFGQSILAHDKTEGETWRVLQPPTGTGKTQGLCVYASMVSEELRERVGVMTPTQRQPVLFQLAREGRCPSPCGFDRLGT